MLGGGESECTCVCVCAGLHARLWERGRERKGGGREVGRRVGGAFQSLVSTSVKPAVRSLVFGSGVVETSDTLP